MPRICLAALVVQAGSFGEMGNRMTHRALNEQTTEIMSVFLPRAPSYFPLMPPDALAAYGPCSADYAEHVRSMASAYPSDVQLVTTWAASVDAPVLDAGCGSGHWTTHLAAQGMDV
jgi:2-polyprenyl-3-methyl-5-hydroxy-6-metoxy-1,4-benzoquinol methylase